MGRAQGELRGQLTKTNEPEAQYYGGEQGAGATPEVAARTVAAKRYRDQLAHLGYHERWEGGRLIGFTSDTVASRWAPAVLAWQLVRMRYSALGYVTTGG